MIIQVLNQKSRANVEITEFTPAVVEDNILSKLNYIIDWDKAIFPTKLKAEAEEKIKDLTDPSEVTKITTDPSNWIEDREYLGGIPELKPGDVFKWDSTLYSVNSENSIIQLISETGVKAFGRLSAVIDSEFDLRTTYDESDNISVSVNKSNISLVDNIDELERLPLSTFYVEIFRNKLGDLIDKEKSGPSNLSAIEITSSDIIIPAVFYVMGTRVFYLKEDMDPLSAEAVFKDVVSWCLHNN